MKRRNEKQNVKLLGAASVVGIAAVAVSLIAAYSSTMKRLTPTQSDDRTFSYSTSSSDIPVQNSVPNVPLDRGSSKNTSSSGSSKPESSKASSSSDAEEANRPVTVDIGNILPVEGEVSNPFSNGELVKSETLGVWKTHDGCDILCELGTDVKSMSEGVVKIIDNSSVYGVCVTVEQSNGLTVEYCGLAKELNVKAGAVVKQGEIIGKTGDTNLAESLEQPHLHLAVKQNGKWIDPMSVIDKTE